MTGQPFIVDVEKRFMKHVYLTWSELEELVSRLIFKLNTPYDLILAITRGGIIPGGMIAEALKMKEVLTAAVLFPEDPGQRSMLSWPRFLQFPADELLRGRKILVVDNLWYRGRTIMAVKGRIEIAGGYPELAVLHWKKASSIFSDDEPNYYAQITEDFIHYPWQRIDDSDYRVRIEPSYS
ncbi:MAG: phosphoribosyltransferase [Chloroflexi bacterium]|nr:phosphoribosyltransferase [Chloroflexota bacterium]